MTQPYPFTHTADTWHAKASAATRLRSSPLVGSLLAIAAGSLQVGGYAPRGTLSIAGEKPLRGDRADQRRTDPISAKPVPHQSLVRCPLAVQ